MTNDIDLTLDTRCNRRVDHVPNGIGGYADGVCDPAGGYSFTDVARQNFGTINIEARPPRRRVRAEVLILSSPW